MCIQHLRRQIVRYIALFMGILLSIACLLVKARLPRKKWNPDLKWFDLKLMMDRSFGLYTLGAFLVMWGLWAPFDYISTLASSAGFMPALSIYLISIINVASVPGRIIPGYVADKLGYFNVVTTVSVLTGITVACLWIPFNYHRSHAGISLMMPCAAKSGTLDTLGQRLGTFQSVIAIALTGLPIQGAILNAEHWSYLGMQIFSAVAMILGGFLIGAARMFIASSQGSAKV